MVIDHIRVHPILLLRGTPVVQHSCADVPRHARMRERTYILIVPHLLRGLAHDAAHLLCTLCVLHTAHQLRTLILLHLFSYQACCHIGKQSLQIPTQLGTLRLATLYKLVKVLPHQQPACIWALVRHPQQLLLVELMPTLQQVKHKVVTLGHSHGCHITEHVATRQR